MGIADIIIGGSADDDAPSAAVEGNLLIIDCRSCRFDPMPGSGECISCMVESMCRAGSADRVVLRTGRDTEISGRAGRVLKEVASLRRWSIPEDRPPGRCRGCPVSRREVMVRAWACFPGRTDPEIRASLSTDVPDRDGCGECAAGTLNALDRMEEGVAGIRAGMAGRSRPWRASFP